MNEINADVTTSDEAIDAMALALQVQGVGLVDLVRTGAAMSQDHVRIVLASALSAGVERLQPAGELLAAVRQCRICGCTDAEACPGGCSWAQPEICSTCAARQHALDEQYLMTLANQAAAAELQCEQARAQLEFIAAGRALIDEQAEVAKLQREDLAGATWRQAVACAAAAAPGSPTQDDGVHERIQADAEWFEHLLGTPPVDDFATDDVLFFTEPAEDADDEEDCTNCGTDDDEHEEGCPKEADQ